MDRVSRREFLALAAVSLIAATCGDTRRSRALSQAELAQAVAARLAGDAPRPAAVAIVDRDGPPTVALSPNVTNTSRFEIGSITKTITATALASVVGEGLASLDDEIGKWVDGGPNGVITLRQLGTHTSGLPRLPAPIVGTDPANPYANYTADEALEYLPTATLAVDGRYEYSNFGFMLLGLVLEKVTGKTFDDLLRQRIFTPLGMTTASTAIDGESVQGHANGQPVSHWDMPLAGAGGVHASIDDMIGYLKAQTTPSTAHPGVATAIALTHDERLAWAHADDITWHNGRTGGFSSMLAFGSDSGVVALVADSDPAEDLTTAGIAGAKRLN